MRPFLDDTAQIIGTSFEFGNIPAGRSEREKNIAETVLRKAQLVYNEAQKIGGVKYLPAFDAWLMRTVYLKKYSKKAEGAAAKDIAENAATSGCTPCADSLENPALTCGENELALRRELVELGNRLVAENLVQGTWGNLSARLDDEYMLVTPSGIDYEKLGPGDMVKVKLSDLSYEGGLKPTSEKGIHAGIYLKRSDVGAVIHAHSTYASVYAATEKPMIIEGDVAERIGREIPLAGYGLPGTKKLCRNTLSALGMGKACIMSHHGMVVCGKNMTDAMENALLVEQQGREALN